MKLSQFKDKKKRLEEFRKCSLILNNNIWKSKAKKKFIEIPKLNLLLRSDTSLTLFFNISKEYRSNKIIGTKILTIGYIFLISVLLKLRILGCFFTSLTLKVSDFYPIILGGNNRLRFIDSTNNNAILIAKNTQSNFFIRNAVKAHQECHFDKLDLIPLIMPFNNSIYFEKQIKGLAINRFSLSESDGLVVEASLNKFFSKQDELCDVIALDLFLMKKEEILIRHCNNYKIQKKLEFVTIFRSISEHLVSFFGIIEVKTTPSHGDLNQGNVFYNKGKVSIIDWEYYMNRYIDYDRVIYKNNLRHKTSDDFFNFIEDFEGPEVEAMMFLVEELLFRILNFKIDVADSQRSIDELVKIIRDRMAVLGSTR